MFADSLPGGADVVSVVSVLHDPDGSTARSLLRRIHAVLRQGGTLPIAEPMAGANGAQPVGDTYFGMHLLAMGSGRARNRQAAQRGADCGESLTPSLFTASCVRRGYHYQASSSPDGDARTGGATA